MRNFLISFGIIVVLWQVSGLFGPSRQDKPSETFVRMTAPPGRSITNPADNGYFMLLGLAAQSGANPIQTGYEVWLESNASQGQRGFDFDKPGRSELHIPVSLDEILPEWTAPTPWSEFQSRQVIARTSTSVYRTIVARYDQWLRLRFDDWGFAHRGIPRIEDLIGAHRLFIVEGFGRHPKTGLERLMIDLARWRFVLRDARTIGMKVTAQVLLEDDLQLLSRLLNEDQADRTAITQALEHLQPLSPGEYSLRWPIHSEFTLGYARTRSVDPLSSAEDRSLSAIGALARAAHLYTEDFQHVEIARSRAARYLPISQRTWDTYAAQYSAAVQAVEASPAPHPVRLRAVSRPDQGVASQAAALPEFDPAWEPFRQRLAETDARLRLVSLQILMRKPTATVTIPSRLAEVGSRYFDPFTGFPMLWSPTQHRLYSTGKDGLDDGGDPTFDISVPLTGALYRPAPQPTAARSVTRR